MNSRVESVGSIGAAAGLIDRVAARAAGLRNDFALFRERRRVAARVRAELYSLTDRELNDIGISRYNIDDIAREHAVMYAKPKAA